MAILLDTSVLGRLANRVDVLHPVATAAIATLHRRGETMYITPQNLIEFRNFATRPVRVNGLGLPAMVAETLGATFETAFPLLAETPDIYPAWKAVVGSLGITGKQVHDARLVAICHAHSVTHLLTFNLSHFIRLAGVGPGVVVVDPATV
jgi:predicted nucleic acid-binding protein